MKSDKDLSENYIEHSVKRKGDTVTYVVPKVVLKDTVIYTYNQQGTILKTIYDKQGNVSQIDCYASAFEQMSKIYNKILLEKTEQQTQTETDVLKQFIPYLFGAIAFVCCFALVLFFIYVKLKF